MKKLFLCILCLCMLIPFAVPVSASNEGTVVFCAETQLENGITLVEEIEIFSNTRSAQKQGIKRNTYKSGEMVIATIAFKAIFLYDGMKSTVVSKQVIQTDILEGWTYTQNSFTSVADTVTLTGQLRKIATGTVAVNMSLTCDANGNLS